MTAVARATLVSLRRNAELALAAVISLLLGSAVASSDRALPVTVVIAFCIGTVVTFVIAAEVALIAIIVTSPVGLERLTGGDRTLLQSYGGWAVSSVRLGVLLLVGLAVLFVRGLPRRLFREEYIYLALVGWIAATLLFSPDHFAGLRWTAKLAILPVAWLAFGWVVRKYGADFTLRLLLITLAAALAIDYLMIGAGLNFHHYPDAPRRFAGLSGEPASGALSLAAPALAALYLWLRDKNPVALALYVLAWGPILMTITRIAIFGFAVASLALLVLMRRPLQAVAVAAIVGIVLLSYAPLRERMAFGPATNSWQTITATVRNQGVSSLNTEGRTELWSALSKQFHQHPIEGSGVGASERVLKSTGTFGGVSQAHSDYMALLVNGGVIALALWLAALGGLGVRLARRGGSALPAAAAVLLYLVAAVTDNAVEMYAYLGVPLAVMIAVGLAGNERDEAQRQEPSGRASEAGLIPGTLPRQGMPAQVG